MASLPILDALELLCQRSTDNGLQKEAKILHQAFIRTAALAIADRIAFTESVAKFLAQKIQEASRVLDNGGFTSDSSAALIDEIAIASQVLDIVNRREMAGAPAESLNEQVNAAIMGLDDAIDEAVGVSSTPEPPTASDTSGNFGLFADDESSPIKLAATNKKEFKALLKDLSDVCTTFVHSGDYGQCWVSPVDETGTHDVIWNTADSDGDDEDTPFETIEEKLQAIDGIREVRIENEIGRPEGWEEVEYKVKKASSDPRSPEMQKQLQDLADSKKMPSGLSELIASSARPIIF